MSIELTRHGAFALITINRPDALNALNFGLLDNLSAAFDQAATGNARALLIIGAGDKAFCAGADVKELIDKSAAQHRAGIERGQHCFAKLNRLPIASVAVINGYAFGGGLELALACTFRLAAANAKLGFPEIKLGLIPGYGGTQRLPRVVGEARALDMIMTGRMIDAAEARDIGLVHRIIDGEPLTAAAEYAESFANYSLPVLRHARSAVQRALDVPVGEGLTIEGDLSTLAYQTTDAGEGIAAFIGKRKPDFHDR